MDNAGSSYSVEVVVVTHDSQKHIAPCLDSLKTNGAVAVVVDNESNDSTTRIVSEQYPQVKLIPARGNLGYGRSVNKGFRETTGEFVLLSNSDVIYLPGSIQRLVDLLMDNADIGLVGPQQIFPNGGWQWSYGDLPGLWSGFKAASGVTTFQNACHKWFWPRRIDREPKDVPYVGGAAVLVRRKAFEAIGGFDESFFRYGDEADLCARLHKAGWRTVFCPASEVIHVRGGDSVQISPFELLQNMVDSDMRVARKHLSPSHAAFYFRLKQLEYQRLSLMYKALHVLAPSKVTGAVRVNSASARDLVQIWRNSRRRSSAPAS